MTLSFHTILLSSIWRKNACTNLVERCTRILRRSATTIQDPPSSTKARRVRSFALNHMQLSHLQNKLRMTKNLTRLEVLQTPRPNLRRIPLHHTLHNRQAFNHRPTPHNREEARRSSGRLYSRYQTQHTRPRSFTRPSLSSTANCYPATTPTRVRGRRTQFGDS